MSTNLTLREKCAQMTLADYSFEKADYEGAIAQAKNGVGGFRLVGGTIFDVAPIVNSLQRHAPRPLLFVGDYGDGVGRQVSGATILPSNLALGASRNPQMARLKGRVLATEAAALGVRAIPAPDPASFGSEAKLAEAFVEGLHEKGVLTLGKGADVDFGAVTEEDVKAGRISEEAVTRAAEAILAVKEKLGLFKDRKVDAGAVEAYVGIEAHRDAARQIAEESITLVKGDGVIQGEGHYVYVADVANVPGNLSVFEKHLTTGIGRMVIGVFFATEELPDHLVKRVQASFKQDPEAVLVSFGNPQLIRQFPEAKHYVCAWSDCEASQMAAAWAVQGKIPFRGKAPVDVG